MLHCDMRLSIISYMRNEADVVEAFVRHHARLAERMIVMLRPSEDETGDVLEQLRSEGLPLTILPDASPEFRQAQALQEAFSLAMKDEPDWILPLDADEFLTGDGDLPAAFASLPTDVITLLPWRTYVPTAGDHPDESNVLRRITHRRADEVRPFSKALIPSSLFRHAHLQTGNHTVIDRSTEQPFPTVPSDSLSLAHFPVRSVAQIARKITSGWNGLTDPALARQVFHWRDLHARFAIHPPAEADLTTIALHYALHEEDPTPGLIHDPVA